MGVDWAGFGGDIGGFGGHLRGFGAVVRQAHHERELGDWMVELNGTDGW